MTFGHSEPDFLGDSVSNDHISRLHIFPINRYNYIQPNCWRNLHRGDLQRLLRCRMEEVQGVSIAGWLKATAIALASIFGLFLSDVIVGLFAYPHLPFYLAAMQHIGFVATIFVSPILLSAVVFGTIRAIASKFLWWISSEL